MTNFLLNTSIENIKGVGPKVKIQLEKIGIETIQDALFYLPKSYENRTKITKISDVEPGNAYLSVASVAFLILGGFRSQAYGFFRLARCV